MRSSAITTALSLLLGSALGLQYNDDSQLPKCGYVVQPCACPYGTTFGNSTTRALIGASANDVALVTGDFYATDWEYTPLLAIYGPDNVVGAVRNVSVITMVGNYTAFEELTEYVVPPGGGFIWRFEQATVPIEYYGGNGSFSGYWVTVDTVAIGPTETFVEWTINSCFTGAPLDLKYFKESSLLNAIQILKSSGKLVGQQTINPFTY